MKALGRAAKDSNLASQVAEDYTKANLNIRERAIADFTVKVTRSPNACSPEDLEHLRKQEMSDRDILSLVEIIGYYNMSTRIFESLSTID
ncbi:MAG: hypothetical protein HQM13_19895 [SAR324 cluster bacterium]|nr:hypothetical protein [SAR324 cluster bacterium]